MFIEKRNFKNSKGLILAAIYEGEDKNAPVIVMCHGYQSSKNSPMTQKALARKLVERGLSVYRFDFTGHGESEGDLSVLTPLQGLDDLRAAVKDLNVLGKKKFCLYGSSFGGNVALLYASERSVLALALKAPVSDYTQTAAIIGRPHFIEDTKSIDLYKKVKSIKCPVFIIHGNHDDVVPLTQSEKLYQALVCDKRLQVIHGADHDIKGEDLEKTYNLIAGFFKRNLLAL